MCVCEYTYKLLNPIHHENKTKAYCQMFHMVPNQVYSNGNGFLLMIITESLEYSFRVFVKVTKVL